jgi:hypothetical protein
LRSLGGFLDGDRCAVDRLTASLVGLSAASGRVLASRTAVALWIDDGVFVIASTNASVDVSVGVSVGVSVSRGNAVAPVGKVHLARRHLPGFVLALGAGVRRMRLGMSVQHVQGVSRLIEIAHSAVQKDDDVDMNAAAGERGWIVGTKLVRYITGASPIKGTAGQGR